MTIYIFYLADMMYIILWKGYLLLIFIQIIIILRTDHLLVRHEIHRETDDVCVLQAAPKTSV